MTGASIADLVHPVSRTNPAQLGTKKINYIDIASIDRDAKNVSGVSYIDASSAPSRARQLLLSNDVLVSTVRPNLNAVAIIPSHLDGSIGSTGFCVLRADHTRLLPDYLFYYSQTATFVSHLTRIANGASYPAVSDDDILETTIPLPPMSEQERIVRLLKDADRLRRMRRSALSMCDELLEAVFLQMFGNPHTNPKGWDQCTIDDVLEWSQYGTSQKSNSAGHGYPILGMANITERGQITLSPLAYVDIAADEFERLKLKSGDIVFNRTNSTELVGKTACWRLAVDAVVASYLVRLRLKSSVNPEFFSQLLNTSHYKRLFQRRCKKAVNQSNISPTLLREFPIYLPSLDLQEGFANLAAKQARLRSVQLEAIRQADHLFQALLHQAFSQ